MKEQPQFEARVGESDPDPVLPRQTEGGVDLLRCVLVPVEDHPKLSPHGFGARAQADCGCYGRVRLVTVVTLSPRVLRSELNGEAQLCCIPVVQPVKIRPLGLPFADGEQDLLPSSNVRGPAPERSASSGLPASSLHFPRERRGEFSGRHMGNAPIGSSEIVPVECLSLAGPRVG